MPLRPAPNIFWLVIGLPAATLAAGIVTLAVIGGHGLDRVADPVQRTAQVQVAAIPGDAEAAALGLAGRLSLSAAGTRFTFNGMPPDGVPESLRLDLEHPLAAEQDITLHLVRHGEAWQGPGFDAAIGWRLVVAPVDARWRIVSRWTRDADAVLLHPALSAPDEAGDASR